MNLGFFTDLHFRGENPSGRTDDYRRSLLLKLEEMGEIWEKNNVEYVLFGGDLCHTPDPVTSIKYDLMQEFKNWKLPIISIIGSHDYYGYQIKSISRTTIGLFEKAGILQIIGSSGFPSYFDIKESLSGNDHLTRIIGTSHTWWLCDDVNNFYSEKEPSVNYQVQLVHGDLLDTSVPWSHILCKDVKTESDLVLSGHYHPGWEKPLKIDNTVFINPGSMGRVETSSQRIPRVCIISTEDRSTKLVSLSSCEVHPFIDREDSMRVQNSYQDITKLLNTLEGTSIELVDIKKKLPVIVDELKFESEILEKCFEIIERVNKENV